MSTATASLDRTARRRRLVAPVAVTLAGVAALVFVYAVDPNRPGHYPLCPFHAITGLDCPGCGATRGLHDLLHGDVAGALDHNVLLALAVPAALLAWWGWVRRSWTGSTLRWTLPNPAVYAVIAVLLAFWVVRNLPGVPYLGAGIGPG